MLMKATLDHADFHCVDKKNIYIIKKIVPQTKKVVQV